MTAHYKNMVLEDFSVACSWVFDFFCPFSFKIAIASFMSFVIEGNLSLSHIYVWAIFINWNLIFNLYKRILA